jgi:hypothetical protein
VDESNYPGTWKAWLVDRIFMWWDWAPRFAQQWAMNNDHY